ncbi:MAG: hypothetical protein WKF77_04165 [Planctomycetaceae bacterium]
MAKWITAAIVAALFFSVGLFAGHSVPFTTALAKGVIETSNPGRAADQKPFGDIPVDSTAADDSRPMAFVSHATAIENAEFRTAELMEQGVSGDEHRRAIRNLIQQHFPNTDAVAAEIWGETYAEMSLDEITFILEQKRLISHESCVGLSTSTMQSTPLQSHNPLAEPLPLNPELAGDIAVRVVETNLRSAYSLGFRRMVVLPEAIPDPESWTPEKRRSAPATIFRSFEFGTLISSPIATHVALTQESSAMFFLEGNRLTRRGDFQLLADRRLGIVTSREEMASAESTPLPEGATNVQILQNGTIQFQNAAGETGEAGRIAVCNVRDLADLQSTDGVFFTATDAGDVIRHEDTSAMLRTHTLEQSNVDRLYENSLLAYLKSLSITSVE